MTDEWFAGFFDGEGCISGRSYFQKGKYIKHPRVHIQISLTQKDRGVLEQIQKQYGGTVYDKHKGCSHLRWLGKEDMKRILLIVAAHGICKKEQALQGLRFIETLRDENLGCVPLSAAVHHERREIYDNLRSLKVVNAN